MKTFLAKLLFLVSVKNDDAIPEFDEQIRLIQSATREDALYKARQCGRREEEEITDTASRKISWQFIDVAELYALDTLQDGEQIYSSSVHVTDADAYINYIRRKSMELQTQSLTFA